VAAAPVVPPATGVGSPRRKILLLVPLLLLAYYFFATNWSIYELGRCLLGLAVLWGPLGTLLYFLLRRSVADPTVRLALSFAASYSLTTLLYFAVALMGAAWLFVVLLIGAAGAALWLGRPLLKTKSIDFPRLDAVLLTIVAASLVTTIPYNTVVTVKPSGDRVITGFSDHFYHAGLEYELSRHVPPSQASIRGGTAERAYHMFPHLTAMLLARFTGQSEMLRAHGVYHYAAITVLICLALYGTGFLLTATTTGGYVCAFLPFLFAIAMRPIIPNRLGYFFFTVLPHATSTVVPTLGTSPQMYCGIAVMYGVLLGIAALMRMPKAEGGGYVLPVICGLMVATLLRFRVHCWIATLPVFLVFVGVMWYRSRRAAWIISAVVATGVSALLYREMFLPVYMRSTAEVHLALNRLSDIYFYPIWPFSSAIEQLLPKFLSGTLLNWTWQMVCLVAFTIWDILGIPLCIVLALVPSIMKRSRAIGYYLFTMGMILISMTLALCLAMGYDPYSVPAQFAYHFGWYTLPLEGVGITWLVLYVKRRSKHAWILWTTIAVISGVASAWTQRQFAAPLLGPDSVITQAAWDAFHYLKESTPDNAIVLSSSPWDRKMALVSGLGGRSGYQDMAPNPVDNEALRLNPNDNRTLKLDAMGAARDPVSVCSVVTSAPITHILEEASNPLMPNLPCLQRLWTGSDGVTVVWRVGNW
jgi:hypothetical protein